MNAPTKLSSKFSYIFKFKVIKCPETNVLRGKTSELLFSFNYILRVLEKANLFKRRTARQSWSKMLISP